MKNEFYVLGSFPGSSDTVLLMWVNKLSLNFLEFEDDARKCFAEEGFGNKRIKEAFFLSARRNLTQWELNHQDTMNACRRIHSLRAHRQKTNVNKSENWHSTYGFKHQHGDDLVTVLTLYTVIIMILLMALWGAWSREDSSL